MLLLTSCLLHRCHSAVGGRALPPLACAAGLPPLDAAFLDSLHGTATALHTEQCENSVRHFDTGSLEGEGVAYALSENDYVTHTVRSERLTGPDAHRLSGGAHIHQTRLPVLSDAEVDALTAEASAAMRAGVTSDYDQLSRASANLGEVRTAQLPEARAWLTTRLADTIFPMLSERYGIEQSSLRVFDSLIIHYDADKGASSQVTHRDAALLSVNIALSQRGQDYEGGGTFFEGLRDDETFSDEAPDHAGEATSSAAQSSILTLDKGHCMCHASGLRHAVSVGTCRPMARRLALMVAHFLPSGALSRLSGPSHHFGRAVGARDLRARHARHTRAAPSGRGRRGGGACRQPRASHPDVPRVRRPRSD